MSEVRVQFHEALDALRVDVDALGRLVQDAVAASVAAVVSDDQKLAASVIAGDDRVDALFVALEEQTYQLIALQAPVASDLRLLMSALRVMSDYEKAGDRAVAVAKTALERWEREAATLTQLGRLGDLALSLMSSARQAWLEQDLAVAVELKGRDCELDACYRALVAHLLSRQGEQVTGLVLHGYAAGRSLERIGDHAVMVGERVMYLLTGDPSALAAEIQ